jgi:hypothetical protein
VNQFYRRKPRTNIWRDIGSRFAPVELVHRSGDLYWFAVCAGKMGSPVRRFITTYTRKCQKFKLNPTEWSPRVRVRVMVLPKDKVFRSWYLCERLMGHLVTALSHDGVWESLDLKSRWPDIGSRFAPVKLVHRSGDLSQLTFLASFLV